MSYSIQNGMVYDISDGNMLSIGNAEKYSTTNAPSQTIYQWQTFNIDTGIYENDTTNTTQINGVVPTNGQVIISNLPLAVANIITQITDDYNQTIYNTFPSIAFDGATEETYACDVTSQMRINGEVTMAMAVKAGFSTEVLSWKNTSQPECVTWTADQMLKLGIDLHGFVTTQTDNLEALTVYINSLTTVDAVNAVTWGMTIPTT